MKTLTIAHNVKVSQSVYYAWLHNSYGNSKQTVIKEPNTDNKALKRLNAWQVYNDAMSPMFDAYSQSWRASEAQNAYKRLTRNMEPVQAVCCQDAMIDTICGKHVDHTVYNGDFQNWNDWLRMILVYA